MSRAKGNRLERLVAGRLLEADGRDPVYEPLVSSAGRVGHLDLGADIISREWAFECKNREDLTDRLWTWLAHISVPGKWKALVVKRNGRPPLVVLGFDEYCALLERARA